MESLKLSRTSEKPPSGGSFLRGKHNVDYSIRPSDGRLIGGGVIDEKRGFVISPPPMWTIATDFCSTVTHGGSLQSPLELRSSDVIEFVVPYGLCLTWHSGSSKGKLDNEGGKVGMIDRSLFFLWNPAPAATPADQRDPLIGGTRSQEPTKHGAILGGSPLLSRRLRKRCRYAGSLLF